MKEHLTTEQKLLLDSMLNVVKLSVILAHIAESTFEAADSCDGEGRDALMQSAAATRGAQLVAQEVGQ